MSRRYYVAVTVEDFKFKKMLAIINAVPFGSWSAVPQQLCGTLSIELCPGETPRAFEDRLTKKIIEVNQAHCRVLIAMVRGNA